MRLVEIIRQPAPNERDTLIGFVESVAAASGEQPLSDHLWLDLNKGGSDGFVAVRVADESGTIALAQISSANESSSLEVVVAAGVDDKRTVHDDAADTAIDTFRRSGGGSLYWWVDEPTGEDQDLARRHGLSPERSLYEMRRPLPTGQRSTVETRAFVPGSDDEAWLQVNNRAFASHGEQGGWTKETLALRMGEPWFDPAGFRLHERDGHLAAFCWTKLHTELDPVVGEIYVIAVDPEFHGHGLGKQLTLAGLDSIHDRGITEANLYVDGGNAVAVSLYERLGFVIHRTRQAFAGDLSRLPEAP